MAERGGKRGDDALHAAMARVRGTHRRQADADQERRPVWDVRGRVADDLARVATPAATAWPRPLAGLVAGLWSSAMSWLVFGGVVLVAWVFAPLGAGEFADVARGASALWLVADGGVVHWQGATISLMPLLASLVIVLFQRRAGGWLIHAVDVGDARSARSPLLFAVLASASVHALVVASIMNASLQVPLWRSLLGASVLAALGFGWGVARSLVITIPDALRPALLVAVRFLVGSGVLGGVLVVASVISNRDGVMDVLGALAGDTTSKVQVMLVCIAYLPTLVGWAAALGLGPGFSLGSGTLVSLGSVTLGALPPIPLFALIPESLPRSAVLLLIAPLIVALWATSGVRRGDVLPVVLPAAIAVAAAAALLSSATAGGIGPARLTQIGPVWWHVAAASAAWVIVASLLRLGLEALRSPRIEADVATPSVN